MRRRTLFKGAPNLNGTLIRPETASGNQRSNSELMDLLATLPSKGAVFGIWRDDDRSHALRSFFSGKFYRGIGTTKDTSEPMISFGYRPSAVLFPLDENDCIQNLALVMDHDLAATPETRDLSRTISRR